MSIFKGRDAKLPLLTQAYQIDQFDLMEVAELRLRFYDWTGKVALEGDASRPTINESLEFNIGPFQSSLQVVRSIMESLADRNAVRADDLLLSWNLWTSTVQRPGYSVGSGSDIISLESLLPDEEYISAENIHFAPKNQDPLDSQMLSDLHFHLALRTKFLRCFECISPFLVTRPERNGGMQRYCSHRCAARAAARESSRKKRDKNRVVED